MRMWIPKYQVVELDLVGFCLRVFFEGTDVHISTIECACVYVLVELNDFELTEFLCTCVEYQF